MRPALVADVGNTCIKWGRCDRERVVEIARLPLDQTDSWQATYAAWELERDVAWMVAGVHPTARDQFARWLTDQGSPVALLNSPLQLPLQTALEFPEMAGIDRLLNAVAANHRRQPDQSAVIIDAGSAVTVDVLGKDGVFLGGAILPGLRLMSKALHQHTALLPLIEVKETPPYLGASTEFAMAAGIFWTTVGGIEKLLAMHRRTYSDAVDMFLTGGDAELLAAQLPDTIVRWPEMTLEGIRLAHLHSLTGKPDQ